MKEKERATIRSVIEKNKDSFKGQKSLKNIEEW